MINRRNFVQWAASMLPLGSLASVAEAATGKKGQEKTACSDPGKIIDVRGIVAM